MNKVKTCVFISGNGSNLKSILKSSRDYNFPIKIELIISNNKKAKGLIHAKKYGIPFKFFSSDNKKVPSDNTQSELGPSGRSAPASPPAPCGSSGQFQILETIHAWPCE